MAEKDEVLTVADECGIFIEKARAAAAVVTEIKSFEEAVDYVVDLCNTRELSRIPIDDDSTRKPGNSVKTIAAPALEPEELAILKERCENLGIDCIAGGGRERLTGVDVGFTYGDIGIAETGTVVINCPSEELRLATMLCEYHVCIVFRSKVVKDAFAAEPQLQKFMLTTPNYTAFITGPSRTADIERVLAIGVHGPLELHVLLLED